MKEYYKSIIHLFTCKIGFHNWGQWSYSHESSCEQLRSCNRCGFVDIHIRLVHEQWGEWAYCNNNSDSFEQQRFCKRCKYEDTRSAYELELVDSNAYGSAVDEYSQNPLMEVKYTGEDYSYVGSGGASYSCYEVSRKVRIK
jgi:hypothetical protein